MQDLTSLKKGDLGIITETIDQLPLKLVEMGCLPGSLVEVIQIAPLNDPMYISINGSHIAIRKKTAKQIKIIKE